MKTLLIESHEENGVEWGISFNGSNPEPYDYFKMPDKETAISLIDHIEKSVERSKEQEDC